MGGPHGERLRVGPYRQAAEVIADLVGGLAVADDLGDRHADRLQPAPRLESRQVYRGFELDVRPRLAAAVARLHGLAAARRQAREIVLPTARHVVDDRLGQRPLVPIQRQHAVPLRGDDRPGDLLLAAHRVDRHHAPGDVDQLQKLGDRRDLVGLGIANGQKPMPGGDRLFRDAILAVPDVNADLRRSSAGTPAWGLPRAGRGRRRVASDSSWSSQWWE